MQAGQYKVPWAQALAWLVGVLVTASAVHANEPALPPRALLVVEPSDAELVARVQGQSADLALQLVPVALELAQTRTPQSLRTLAQQRGAAATVWIHQLPDGAHQLLVVEVQPGQSAQIRDVPLRANAGALDESATREALAIVVRAELLAWLTRVEVQREHASETAAAGPDTASAADGGTVAGTPASPASGGRDAGARSADAHDRAADPRRLGLRLLAGWELGWAGPGHVAQAFALQSGVHLGVFELALGGALGLSTVLGDGPVVADVARHGMRVSLLAQLPLSAAWQLLAGVDAGALVFARNTRAHDPTLSGTPSNSSLSAAFGAELLLRWLGFGRVGFELGMFASAVTAAPRYVVQRGSVRTLQAHDAWLEPTCRLALIWAP